MEALKSVEFEVGGNKYLTSVMPATDGRVLFLAFVKVLSPALEKLTFDDKADAAKKESTILAAAASVIGNLDPNTLELFCEAFGKSTYHIVSMSQRVPMDRGYFGLHFAGRYVEMMRWVLECCKVNGFLGFLSGN